MSQQVTPMQYFNSVMMHPDTQEHITKLLGEKKGSFVSNVTTLVANNANLQACPPKNIIYAALKATALDLPLDSNLGFAYVIPYKDGKTGKFEAQFQLGYRGFIQLAIRSGQFRTINVTEVKAGEVKDFDMLTGETRFEAKKDRESLPTIGYAAFFRLTNGFEKTLYMTKEAVEAHAYEYSQTYKADKNKGWKSSQWTKNFDAMAKKTVLKLLLSRFAPMSVEMQQAISSDQAVFNAPDGAPRYVDNHIEEAEVEDVQPNTAQAKVADAIAKATGEASEVVDTETGELLPTGEQGDDTLL